MIKKFTIEEYNSNKDFQYLPLFCEGCNHIFYKPKKDISVALKLMSGLKYCKECREFNKKKRFHMVLCKNCNSSFLKNKYELKKRPNSFCNSSCAATFNNKNKNYGYRRSKLEIWLEEQLSILYPNLYIEYNSKTAIGSELDIYIPSLNLAFELNGIFHYEPIYGINKLSQIQNNDISKSKACHDNKIDLCIIDTSKQKNNSVLHSKPFLDIITNIIDNRV